MINNFEIIEKFIEFEENTYYKFEALVRNTDGDNVLYTEGLSNASKTILIKSWCVDSKEYYNKVKHEMITLCDLTCARLYMTLDKKSVKKTLVNLSQAFNNALVMEVYNSTTTIKALRKEFDSCTSIKDSSVHNSRTIMFDVDIKDKEVLNCICKYIRYNNTVPYVLETKKGYHIFCYKKFNAKDWETDAVILYREEGANFKEDLLIHKLTDFVSMKDNQLGLVYMRK